MSHRPDIARHPASNRRVESFSTRHLVRWMGGMLGAQNFIDLKMLLKFALIVGRMVGFSWRNPVSFLDVICKLNTVISMRKAADRAGKMYRGFTVFLRRLFCIRQKVSVNALLMVSV